MKKEKHKRDYLPEFRRLCKDLEDAIIERNEKSGNEAIVNIEITLRKIRRS